MLDASAAIVLFASGHCREIVEAWPGSGYVVQEVVAEAGFLRDPDLTRPDQRVPIDWAPIIDSEPPVNDTFQDGSR